MIPAVGMDPIPAETAHDGPRSDGGDASSVAVDGPRGDGGGVPPSVSDDGGSSSAFDDDNDNSGRSSDERRLDDSDVRGADPHSADAVGDEKRTAPSPPRDGADVDADADADTSLTESSTQSSDEAVLRAGEATGAEGGRDGRERDDNGGDGDGDEGDSRSDAAVVPPPLVLSPPGKDPSHRIITREKDPPPCMKGPSNNDSGSIASQLDMAAAARRLAEKQWQKAASILKSNRSLMTPNILKLALHHRPPLHVVKFMLEINRDAAAVPRSGPSPLQIAVRHGASLEVVEEVIKACPYALFTGNGSYDPLTYAKIWRRDEEDIIELLGRPISHWVQGRAVNGNGESGNSGSDKSAEESVKRGSVAARRRAKRRGNSAPPPPGTAAASSSFLPHLPKEDRRELSNLKLITAAIVRAQRKQLADSAQERREVTAELQTISLREEKARHDLLKSLEERERESHKAQLVALEMHEKAFESRLGRMGNDIATMLGKAAARQEQSMSRMEERDESNRRSIADRIVSLRDDVVRAADRVERACTAYGAGLADLVERVDRECRVNLAFRNETRVAHGGLEQRVEQVLGVAMSATAGRAGTISESAGWEFFAPPRSSPFGSGSGGGAESPLGFGTSGRPSPGEEDGLRYLFDGCGDNEDGNYQNELDVPGAFPTQAGGGGKSGGRDGFCSCGVSLKRLMEKVSRSRRGRVEGTRFFRL